MGRRGAQPRHGARAGKPKEAEQAAPEPDVEDVEQVGRLANRKFTPEEALDIAIKGYQHAVALKVLQRKQEQLRKKLATTTKSIEVHAREISALWDDAQTGQGTLPFDEDGSGAAPSKPAPVAVVSADRYVAEYEGRRLSVTREDDGRWTARCATGEDVVHEGLKGEHEERAAAMEHALGMAGYDTKKPRPKWEAAAPEAKPPRAYVLEHGKKKLEAVELAHGGYEARIDGQKIGDFPDARGAMEFAMGESGMARQLFTSAKWSDGSGATVQTDALESPLAEWHATVGKKSAVLRQDNPGRWTARVGDLPVAIDLSLEKAKRLAGVELLRGEPDGTEVPWTRVEREAPEAAPRKRKAK